MIDKALSTLSITHGSSGLTLSANFGQSFNCREFTTHDDRPQPIMIAPWIQFEPADLAEARLKVMTEIIRRAMVHDSLIARIRNLESTLSTWQDGSDFHRAEIEQYVAAWAKERQFFGRAADFSDYPSNEWPAKRQEPLVSADDFRRGIAVLDVVEVNGEKMIRLADVERTFKTQLESRKRFD